MKEEKAGLKFLFIIAAKEVLDCDVKICHSLDIGMRGKFITDKKITAQEIKLITNKMKEYINGNYPILKLNVSRKDAINYYNRYEEYEKSETINNMINETIVFNELLGKYNYFFSNIVSNTKEINYFKIVNLSNNDFVLIDNADNKREFEFKKNIMNEFDKYNEWINKQGIHYVSDLNKIISQGKIEDFIKKNDIIIDDSMMKIAKNIVKLNKKIIFLGGPSSSGKTTSTRKLSLFLNSLGKKTIKVSLDDYYKELEEIIPDETGKRDLESLDAIDLVLFRNQISDLLKGKEVTLPKYNFVLGAKNFDRDSIKLDENDILLVEGLHCLNEVVSKNIPKEDKYKIYVSPLTPLTLDRHNYISTTENRLLRRMIRDNRTRGISVEKTLSMWDSVRNGEDKYIFPFTDEADVILNTSYIYEIGVLKVYAEPLLYTVKMDSPHYEKARSLLDSLKTFYPISSEYLASDNVLREFIGKSEFNEG
ncbi:MAG: hypothetical protein IJD92_01820 [Bacilli bacterium]|nr:hypothetical protein [Bacilli bacterium]